MKTFKISAGTFPFVIRVIICNNLKTSVKYINKKQARKGSDKYDVEHFEDKPYGSIVFIMRAIPSYITQKA